MNSKTDRARPHTTRASRARGGSKKDEPEKTPEQIREEEAAALVAEVTGPMAARAQEVARHTLTLEAKAKECRAAIERMPPFFVNRYYNGETDEHGSPKQHTSVKPNPAIGVYQSLLASYNAELAQLERMIGEQSPQDEKGTTTLTRLRAMNGGKKAG